ncbi:MAG: mannose-6-phosphate isomerase, partial [Gammaproteobacteria bacterium]
MRTGRLRVGEMSSKLHSNGRRTGASLGERPWGRWTVLHRGEGYQVKLLEVRPGQRLSLQFHR